MMKTKFRESHSWMSKCFYVILREECFFLFLFFLTLIKNIFPAHMADAPRVLVFTRRRRVLSNLHSLFLTRFHPVRYKNSSAQHHLHTREHTTNQSQQIRHHQSVREVRKYLCLSKHLFLLNILHFQDYILLLVIRSLSIIPQIEWSLNELANTIQNVFEQKFFWSLDLFCFLYRHNSLEKRTEIETSGVLPNCKKSVDT